MPSSAILQAQVFTRAAFDTEESARALVQYLLEHPDFAPDRFGLYEPLRKFGPELLEKAVAWIVDRPRQELHPRGTFSDVLFARRKPPRCSCRTSWSRLPHCPLSLSHYDLDERYATDPRLLARWLDFIFGLLALHQAWYAVFALDAETYEKNFLTRRHQHPGAKDPHKGVNVSGGVGFRLEQGIPGMYWGNYFGPFYVDWFGRDKLDTVPCVHKRWLDTGGIFFTTAESPFDWNSPAALALQRAAKAHLGANAFFDMETVRWMAEELEPLPDNYDLVRLQPPRLLPAFPFKIEQPAHGTPQEEIENARKNFEAQGYVCVEQTEDAVTFRDAKGSLLRVTVGPSGAVEFWPQSQS